MKKALLVVTTLILMMFVAFTGCIPNNSGKDDDSGSKKNSSEESSDDSDDSKSSGVSVDVDGKVSWPKDSMGDIKKPDAKIVAVVKDEASKTTSVAYEDMSKKVALAYIDELKSLGYESLVDLADDEGLMYSGQNSKGESVVFSYGYDSKEGIVIFSKTGATSIDTPNSDDSDVSEIDMTDDMPWPAAVMDGIPELEGKIVNVTNQNGTTIYVDYMYIDKADFEEYINTLRNIGFNVEEDMETNKDSIDFRAYNEAGDWIYAYFDSSNEKTSGTINFEKAPE